MLQLKVFNGDIELKSKDSAVGRQCNMIRYNWFYTGCGYTFGNFFVYHLNFECDFEF